MEAVFRWGATFLVTLMVIPYAILGLADLWLDSITLTDTLSYLFGFIAGTIATVISIHFSTQRREPNDGQN